MAPGFILKFFKILRIKARIVPLAGGPILYRTSFSSVMEIGSWYTTLKANFDVISKLTQKHDTNI